MIYRTLTLVACLVLSVNGAASARQRDAADGYHWEKAEYTRGEQSVRVHLFNSRSELERKYRDMGGILPEAPQGQFTVLNAFSSVNPMTDMCDIYAIDPAVEYHPESFGHELLHCFYGNWHPYR